MIEKRYFAVNFIPVKIIGTSIAVVLALIGMVCIGNTIYTPFTNGVLIMISLVMSGLWGWVLTDSIITREWF